MSFSYTIPHFQCTFLLHQYHPLRGGVFSGLESVEIDAAREVVAEIVPTVPGDCVGTGLLLLIHQHPHLLPQYIVYRERDTRQEVRGQRGVLFCFWNGVVNGGYRIEGIRVVLMELKGLGKGFNLNAELMLSSEETQLCFTVHVNQFTVFFV